MQDQGIIVGENALLKMMRKYYLLDLFSNWNNEQKNIKEKLSYLKLNSSFTFPVVAVLDLCVSFPDEHKKRKHREDIFDYLEQSVGDSGIIFMNEEGRIGILISWVSKDFIESLNTALNTRYSYPINIGVGRPCNRLENIYHSYQQAILALQGKFYKGMGKIVYFNELEDYQELSKYPLDKEKELFEFLKSVDGGPEIEKAVDGFYDYILQDGLIHGNCIYELTIRLLVGMEKRVYTELNNVSGFMRFNMMSILKMETLQEIKCGVSNYLKELHALITQQDNCSFIIKKTIQYIEQECQNASLDSLAQKVYVTPTYLSSLFKLNTGKTFIEQLTDVRIEKAKELLKNTHLKNYEVAERVGYKDSRYFSQIFRKKVGTTPSEYRKQAGQLVV